MSEVEPVKPKRKRTKPAGSGRKPGSMNLLQAEARKAIIRDSRSIELLKTIAGGGRVLAEDPRAPGKRVYRYPSVEARITAASKLLAKALPDLKSVDATITTGVGSGLVDLVRQIGEERMAQRGEKSWHGPAGESEEARIRRIQLAARQRIDGEPLET